MTTDGKMGLSPPYALMRSTGHGGDDAVGGVGQVGEAVGQAGARDQQVVGVFCLGGAELGQQVQVVAQGLQFGVGFGRQVVTGVGERSVLHGVSFRVRVARRGCGRGMRPQGVGRVESHRKLAGRISPKGVLFRHPPDVERTASEAPDALGIRNPPDLPGWVPPTKEIRRSLNASLRRGWRGVYLHLM